MRQYTLKLLHRPGAPWKGVAEMCPCRAYFNAGIFKHLLEKRFLAKTLKMAKIRSKLIVLTFKTAILTVLAGKIGFWSFLTLVKVKIRFYPGFFLGALTGKGGDF